MKPLAHGQRMGRLENGSAFRKLVVCNFRQLGAENSVFGLSARHAWIKSKPCHHSLAHGAVGFTMIRRPITERRMANSDRLRELPLAQPKLLSLRMDLLAERARSLWRRGACEMGNLAPSRARNVNS